MSDPIIEAAQRTLLVHTRTICTHCVNGEWPCATAKLVYSTEDPAVK